MNYYYIIKLMFDKDFESKFKGKENEIEKQVDVIEEIFTEILDNIKINIKEDFESDFESDFELVEIYPYENWHLEINMNMKDISGRLDHKVESENVSNILMEYLNKELKSNSKLFNNPYLKGAQFSSYVLNFNEE